MIAHSGRVHELRSSAPYFCSVWDGSKTFEVRWNDRGFQAGDQLRMLEWSTSDGYTGRVVLATVTYVMETTPAHGRQPGFRGNGYAVLSIVVIDSFTETVPPGALKVDHASAPTPAVLAGRGRPS